MSDLKEQLPGPKLVYYAYQIQPMEWVKYTETQARIRHHKVPE